MADSSYAPKLDVLFPRQVSLRLQTCVLLAFSMSCLFLRILTHSLIITIIITIIVSVSFFLLLIASTHTGEINLSLIDR